MPLAAALLFFGCGRSAQFPVGFFGVVTPEDIRVVRGEGFDAVQSYETAPDQVKTLAAAARREGVPLLVSPWEIIQAGRKPSDYRGAIWYLQDEPDVNGVSAQQLRQRDKQVKAWAPGMKTAFVVGDGRRAKDYPGAGNVIMVDWYPVPHLPLESAGDHVGLTAQAADGRKVWAVLQAMDWRDFPQRDPKKPRIGRFPDMAEIRFMSYDAVLNGANGVWYFVYTPAPGKNLAQTPELLFAVSTPARELRAMAPIFADGRPVPLPFVPDPNGASARAWTYHGRDYVLIENRWEDRPVEVPKELLEPTWRPLFEVRRDPRELLAEMGGRYYLPPYRVFVLESRLRLGRLLGLSRP